MEDDKRVLKIGGIAGLLGGVLLLGSAIVVLALLQPPFETFEDLLMGYGDVAAAAALSQGLSLAGFIIAIALVIALYRLLKETSREYALTGVLLFVVGIALFGASQGDLFVFPRLAELYVDPMTTDAERTAIVQAAIAMNLVLVQVYLIGSLFALLGVLSLGAVMVGNPSFGKGYGGLCLLLGVVGIVLTVLAYVVPIGVWTWVAPVILLFVFGWKVYSLSRAA